MMRIASLSVLIAVVAADPLTLLEKEKLAGLSNREETPPGISVRVVGGTKVTSKSKYPFLVEWEGELVVHEKRNMIVSKERVLDLDGIYYKHFLLYPFVAACRCQMWRLYDS
jgi:hypothetical protein